MLNPTFPKEMNNLVSKNYVLKGGHADLTLIGNGDFDAGFECRVQDVYGDEIWLKLERCGYSPTNLMSKNILEVCAGGGFLTHHLLSRCNPSSLTVNDISAKEIAAAKSLLAKSKPKCKVNWVLGDMHQVDFGKKFDLILGNSFLHHFHDIPKLLKIFKGLLNASGTFISLHEPTPMSTVVEGAKLLAYPLAVLFPGLVHEIARKRYKGSPSVTDIWMFEPARLRQVALQAGFSDVKIIPWHLFRPIVVQRNRLHLHGDKLSLLPDEVSILRRAIQIDSTLNRFLPHRFFGSFCLICSK